MKSFLKKFLDGDLSPEEERELLHRPSVASRMEEQWGAPQHSASEFDPASVYNRILVRLFPIASLWRSRRVRMYCMRAAAAAASIVLLLSVGLYLLKQDAANECQYSVMIVHETQNEERLMFSLPDSTKLWLNAGSLIEYPKAFRPQQRVVHLTGEAYFDVAQHENQPFIVHTGRLQVHATGTAFTVSDFQSDSFAEAILISGKVIVDVLKNEEATRIHMLPNQRVLYDELLKETVVQTVDAAKQADWIHDRLRFDNTGLAEIFTKLQHWYGVKFEWQPDEIAGHRLSFTVRNENLEQVMRMMQNIAPISFWQDGEKTYRVKNEE